MSDPTYMGYEELRQWVRDNPEQAAEWIENQVARNEPTLGELLGIGLEDD